MKTCPTCAHAYTMGNEPPCNSCTGYRNWTPEERPVANIPNADSHFEQAAPAAGELRGTP